MSSQLTQLLSKLKGGKVGVFDPKKDEFTKDVQMNEEDLKKTIVELKKIRDEAKKAMKYPKKYDKIEKKFVQSCENAGLKEMPDKNGVIADILRKGSLADDTIKAIYINDKTGELVKCVDEKSAKAMERFLSDTSNLKKASAKMDKDAETLMKKLEMLEQSMELVKPFVTGHAQLGKMGARMKLRTPDNKPRQVKNIDGKKVDINTCAASTTRVSCEAKRDSIHGNPGESCLWMPNFNHLTEQALAWQQTEEGKKYLRNNKDKTWQKLQDEVCVSADDFPFPLRDATDDDMNALRRGVAWKADKNRAMVKKRGKDTDLSEFAPHMRDPMNKDAKYGYADGEDQDTTPIWRQALGWIPLLGSRFSRNDQDETVSLDNKKKQYLPNANVSKYNSITGEVIKMPYFFEKDGPMKRHESRPVTGRVKPDYAGEATKIQRMFRSKRRKLPKRIEKKYDIEFERQKSIRDEARNTLKKKFNMKDGQEPEEHEVEDLAMKHPQAKSRNAILQRLIYDVAVQGEWTEAEVYELLKQDLTRYGGHVIIVSTEPGMCKDAYKGIADELENDVKGKKLAERVLQTIEGEKVRGTVYGKRAGEASLCEVFGDEDSEKCKDSVKSRTPSPPSYTDATMNTMEKESVEFLHALTPILSDDEKAEDDAKSWSSWMSESNSDFDDDAESEPNSDFEEEEYLVGGVRLPAPPADATALNNVITILRGGGTLPFESKNQLKNKNGMKVDADVNPKWGLSEIFRSSLKGSQERNNEESGHENTCYHRIPETAAILMKANISLYLPMIQRFYQNQNPDVIPEKMTTSIDSKKEDNIVRLNKARGNETDAQRFVREMYFDEKSRPEEDFFDMMSNIDARRSIGMSLTDLPMEERQELSGNTKALAAAISGPSMTERAYVQDNNALDFMESGMYSPEALPWPVITSMTVIRGLLKQRARGKAGKKGHTLLGRLSVTADNYFQKDMSKYMEELSKAASSGDRKNSVKLERKSIMASNDNVQRRDPFDEGESEIDKYNRTMDEIDATRIILSGPLGAGSGDRLSNDTLYQLALDAYLLRERDEFQLF